MHNIIFPLKDTTIYSKYPEINTGLDEILEITKEISSSNYFHRGIWNSGSYYKRYDYVTGSDGYYFTVAENIGQLTSSAYWVKFNPTASNENSRILIKFDLNNFESEASASASLVYLNLFTSIARKVPTEYTLQAYPVSGTWEMGAGNFTDKLTTGGATWTRRNTTTNWNTEGGDISASSYVASQSYNFVPTDIRMDVTNIFGGWVSGTYPNEGFLIQRPDTQEDDIIKYGSLSFYSLDTHTVYVPTLEILYDDYIYETQSFGAPVTGSLISGSISVAMKNFKPEYTYNETVKFQITVKPSYVAKTFYEQLRIGEIYYLPEDSISYSIRDAYSNRIMIPFSDYTKVSLDETGHYFNVSLSGFMPERFYKMIFKVILDGQTQYFDTDSQFKVVK